MIEVGKYHTLKVLKKLNFGLYLQGEGAEEILIPKAYVTDDINIGDDIEVFIYRDSEDKLLATTLKPFAKVGDIAFLKVKSINRVGAFLDWGLPKDLMVPFREQKVNMVEGKSYIVKLYVDPSSDRIVASSSIRRFMKKDNAGLKEGQEVDIIIFEKTNLGYNVIINSEYLGLVYADEIFKRIDIGYRTTGYIRKLREDGKVDVSLQQSGYDQVAEVAENILAKLISNNGHLMLGDDSDPKQIANVLQVSKKVFKKAVGMLYKQKKIIVTGDSIRLNQ